MILSPSLRSLTRSQNLELTLVGALVGPQLRRWN
jgi:hypothetical protein